MRAGSFLLVIIYSSLISLRIAMNSIIDSKEREQALDLHHSCIVQAPAGSGKTGVLTQRYLACLSIVNDPEDVYALTFTNKATAEMQSRVLESLQEASKGVIPDDDYSRTTYQLAKKVLELDKKNNWGILNNPSRLKITTIDALNSSLTKQLPILSGLGGAKNITDNAALVYREASIALLDEFEDNDLHPLVRDAIAKLLRFAGNRSEYIIDILSFMLGTRDQWLDDINDITQLNSNYALSAYIEDRLSKTADLIPPALLNDLLCLLKSSTKEEISSVANEYDSWPAPMADNLLAWQSLIRPFVAVSTGQFKKKLTAREGFPAKDDKTIEINALFESLKSVSLPDKWLYEVLMLPNPDYPEKMVDFRNAISIVLPRLIIHLNYVFAQTGTIDFVENARRAYESLGGDNNVTELLEKIGYSINHLLVDEFQDTSRTQIKLLSRLVEHWVDGDGRTLFLVGDPMQSIYRFRQADVSIFQNLWDQQHLASVKLTPLTLTSNFRSNSGIVNWFNRTLVTAFGQADPYTGGVAFSPSACFSTDDTGGVSVNLYPVNDAELEAQHITDAIEKTITDYPNETVAVLVRSRTHVTALVEVFKSRHISYCAQKIDRLQDGHAVSDALCLFKALRHPMDRGAWMGLLRSPLVGLTWTDCLAVSQGSKNKPLRFGFISANENGMSEDGLNRLARLINVLDSLDKDATLINDLPTQTINAWYALGGKHIVSTTEQGDIDKLFALMNEQHIAGEIIETSVLEAAMSKLYATPEAGKVAIMTIHEAKGLEFDNVFIPGMGRAARTDDAKLFHHHSFPEGFVITPNPGKEADEKSDEKRLYKSMARLEAQARENEAIRLLYVALTRAKKRMSLFAYVADGEKAKPATGSLLSYIWDEVRDEAIKLPHEHPLIDKEKHNLLIKTPARMVPAASFSFNQPKQVFTPISDRMVSPVELVNDEQSDPKRDMYLRNVGIHFHKIMELAANTGGYETALTFIAELKSTLSKQSASSKKKEAQEAVELVMGTLNTATGRWLVETHDVDKTEWALSGYIDGKWVSGIIDRFIIEGDTATIIDYKSGIVTNNDANQADLRYQRQLDRYKALVSEMYPNLNVETMLYYPRLDAQEAVV